MENIIKEEKQNGGNDYKIFLENLVDALFSVDSVEDYGNYEEYLDEDGATLFGLTPLENGDYNFSFYDGNYTVKKNFLEDFMNAINKISNKIQMQAV